MHEATGDDQKHLISTWQDETRINGGSTARWKPLSVLEKIIHEQQGIS